MTFKFVPGKIYTGKVEAVLQAIRRTGADVGSCRHAEGHQAAPFVVRVRSTTRSSRNSLPAGSTGDGGDLHRPRQAAHVIRQVHAAADRNHELRAAVLIRTAYKRL